MVMGRQTSASTSPILELRGISKSFHGTKVLDGVDFAVRSGEVMALMGENGAGKSTLMKIVTGIYEADPGGTIKLDGIEVRFTNPGQSISAGIAMIHQDLNLLPGLTAAENLYLGREPLNGLGLIDWPTSSAAKTASTLGCAWRMFSMTFRP
jgi:ribose transport system ATP-binding protein